MDDRPGRQQQHRRLAGAVDLVEDADTVALEIVRLVRVAGARLLRGRGQLDSHWSIHASRASWPVSIPPSRSTITPRLKVITSETSASSGIGIPSFRYGSANASVKTPRHSAFTNASRSRRASLFQASACSSSQAFS